MILKKEAKREVSVNRDKRNDSLGTGITEDGAAPSPRYTENKSQWAQGAAGEILSVRNQRALPRENG